MKIILHFDANKTIMMADPVSHKGPDYVFACDLSEDEKYKFQWVAGQPEMTYYEFLDHKFPGVENRAHRKQAIENFVATCENVNHPHASEIKERYQSALAEVARQDTLLVPAFYAVLEHLEHLKNSKQITDFQILIRTFGEDLSDIESELNDKTTLELADRSHFQEKAFITSAEPADPSQPPIEANIQDLTDIYAHWMTSGQSFTVQDDYNTWYQNGRLFEFAKQFPYRRGSDDELSIFFDDNIEQGDSVTNIIAPYDITNQQFIPVSTALDEGNAHVVRPLSIVEDPSYFINLVEKSRLKLKTKLSEAKAQSKNMNGSQPSLFPHFSLKSIEQEGFASSSSSPAPVASKKTVIRKK